MQLPPPGLAAQSPPPSGVAATEAEPASDAEARFCSSIAGRWATVSGISPADAAAVGYTEGSSHDTVTLGPAAVPVRPSTHRRRCALAAAMRAT